MASGALFSKSMWKKIVWGNAWTMEVDEWRFASRK